MSEDDDRKVYAALSRAVQQLESAVHEQEQAVNRILGLAEQLRPRQPDRAGQLQVDAVLEACAFQDLTGQRIRKVARLIRYLRDQKKVTLAELPHEPAEARPAATGLSQAQIDRLLSGGKPVREGE